jgi:hypothetical protein
VNDEKVTLGKQSLDKSDFHHDIAVFRRGKNAVAVARQE